MPVLKNTWSTKLVLGLFLAASIIVLSLGSMHVGAQSTGQGLEISPPLIERQVNPGEKIEMDIKLRNVTDSTVTTTSQVDDFVAAGEDGQPKLLLDNLDYNQLSSCLLNHSLFQF